jgi:3-oxoacyl-[acyl-carrier-protein] synthase III
MSGSSGGRTQHWTTDSRAAAPSPALSQVRIAGWGKYLPTRVMPNSELETLVETSDAWIRSRSGIGERRIAAPDETTATMGAAAAREALARAGVGAADLDLVVVATSTPDHYAYPSSACLIQADLGAERAGAFDLSAACSGFVYALVVASQMMGSGAYQRVLVVGSDVNSRILDWRDRGTCVLFGDGAGAVVLEVTDTPGGLVAAELGADGAGAAHLIVPAGGSRAPATPETVERREHFIRMNGAEVFRFSTLIVPAIIERLCQQAAVSPAAVDLLIPHQANSRIIQSAARRLSLQEGAIFSNLEFYGNTSAASVPIALCEAIAAGRVHAGQLLALVGFGAGLTWAGALWRWHG